MDIMHLLFMNVAPLIVSIWLGEFGANLHDVAYLKSPEKLKVVEERLKAAGDALNAQFRKPIPLKERKKWEAS